VVAVVVVVLMIGAEKGVYVVGLERRVWERGKGGESLPEPGIPPMAIT
jgi:hypothetical protein